MCPEQQRRQREESADERDEHAHRRVGRAEDCEEPAVDVLYQGTVDNPSVEEPAVLGEMIGPVGDAGFVEMCGS
ncbi:hypothetical protein ACFQL1_07845 [Halomicroarcula sp. GCM10025709]|uniref:hypothetical protein n=1 Tax=Halomicroarcula sp. GCM10025709 TaxID=3252669 RepID=UPI00361B0E1A